MGTARHDEPPNDEVARLTRRPDAFLSYSRRDRAVADELIALLAEAGKDVWVDREDIPAASRWRDELARAIDLADAVIVLLTPAWLASENCRQEFDHAEAAGKRILPVLAEPVEDPPAALSALQWIPLTGDGGEPTVRALIEAIEIDLPHVRAHARYLDESRRWIASGRDRGGLLRGSELGEAEEWLTTVAPDRTPRPTADHIAFIHASRADATRRQRVVLGAVAVVAAVLAVLAVFALIQRDTAVEQRATARREAATATSRLLAARSARALGTDPVAAVRQALSASAVRATAEADGAIPAALAAAGHLRAALVHPGGEIVDTAMSRDATRVATASPDGTVALWTVGGGGPAGAPRVVHADPGTAAVALDQAGTLLVAVSERGEVSVFDAGTGRRIAHRSVPRPVDLPGAEGTTALALRSGRLVVAQSLTPPGSRCRRRVRELELPSLATGTTIATSVCPVVGLALDTGGGLRILGADGARETWSSDGARLGRRPGILRAIGPPLAVALSPAPPTIGYLLPRRFLEFGPDRPRDAPSDTFGPVGLSSVPSPIAQPSAMAFSEDGGSLAILGEGRIAVWTTAGRPGPPESIAPVADDGGRLLVSAGGRRFVTFRGDTASVWTARPRPALGRDLAPLGTLGVAPALSGTPLSPVASPSGRSIAWGDRYGGRITVLDVASGRLRRFGVGDYGGTALPTDDRLVARTESGAVRLDLLTRDVERVGDDDAVSSAVAPDGAVALLGPGRLTIDTADGGRVGIPVPDELDRVVTMTSAPGRLVALCGSATDVAVILTPGGIARQPPPLACAGAYDSRDVSATADGRVLAFPARRPGGTGATVVWDSATGETRTLPGSGPWPVIAPDGSRVAEAVKTRTSLESGRTTWRIDVRSTSDGEIAGTSTLTLGENDDPELLWLPDGGLVAAAAGGARLVLEGPEALRARGCRLVGRGLSEEELEGVVARPDAVRAC